MRLACLSLVLTIAAFAQRGGPPPAPAKPAEAKPAEVKPGRIEGVVVSITGEPIARVQVRYSNQSATSDDTGKFVLESVQPARSAITAQKTGFLAASYSRSGAGTSAPLVLASGETIKGLTITMTPQSVIAGRVTDHNNEPIQGIRVQLLRRGYQRGIPQLVNAGNMSTNDMGEYRFASLAPGRYFVSAMRQAQREFVSGTAAPMGEVATFYPNSPDAKGAGALNLAAGQQMPGVDIRMLQGRVFSVRGKMIPKSGALPAQMAVATVPETYGKIPMEYILKPAQPRQDGSFDLRDLLPGRYTLYAVGAIAGDQPGMLGYMPLNIPNEDVVDLAFLLNGGVTLTGSVRLEEGDLEKLMPPLNPNADPTAARAALSGGALGGQSRMAIGLEETGIPFGVAPPAQIAPDGTFSIKEAAPFVYRLRLGALPEGTYVKLATLGGVDALHNALDLTRGGGELRIVLAKGTANVTGTVKKEKDQETGGVYVSLWSQEAESGMANQGVYTVPADQNGKFMFTALRPGTYYAAAWESIDNGLAQTRDFLKLMETEAVKVEVATGASPSPEVPLILKAKIQAAEEKLP